MEMNVGKEVAAMKRMLQRNGRTGGAPVRNKFGALLKGILRCVPCNCAMSPTHSTHKGNKRYRYYVCTNAQKRGWDKCPSKSIPAPEIERFVVDQIKCIGKDPALLNETIAQARSQGQSRVAELEAERRGLERELGKWNGEVRQLLDQIAPNDANTPATARLADLQERIRGTEHLCTCFRRISTAAASVSGTTGHRKWTAISSISAAKRPGMPCRIRIGRRQNSGTPTHGLART